MKITDAVISEFFGKGKGFAVQSIKRWGGFIKDEEDIDVRCIGRLDTSSQPETERLSSRTRSTWSIT